MRRMSSGRGESETAPEHPHLSMRRSPCAATSPVMRWKSQGPCSRAYSSTPSRICRCEKFAVGIVTNTCGMERADRRCGACGVVSAGTGNPCLLKTERPRADSTRERLGFAIGRARLLGFDGAGGAGPFAGAAIDAEGGVNLALVAFLGDGLDGAVLLAGAAADAGVRFNDVWHGM